MEILILALITVDNQYPPHVKSDRQQVNSFLHVQCIQGYE